jgi:chemotaxis protein CheX
MTTRLDAKGRTVLALDATLDVTHAAPLAGLLLGLRGKDIIIDASEVQHLGAQCGQLLVSAKRTWKTDGHALRLEKASADFVENLRLLGLTSLLPVDEHIQ